LQGVCGISYFSNLSWRFVFVLCAVLMVRCTGEMGSTTLDAGDEELRRRGLETCMSCSMDCGTCPTHDTTPPSVSILSPSDVATVSGTIMVSVSASDDVAVAGVRLSLDGIDVGEEDTGPPYALSF